VMAGKNVVLAAETGSGKTLAYLAPVVDAVLRRRAAEAAESGEVQRRKRGRIVTVGVSGGGSLTRPFRDARRFPSTRW
jgi:superfamily II DNA/RNA helicase